MLRHQHMYTTQMLTSSMTPALVNTAFNRCVQVPAANLRYLKKRPAAICTTPIKTDPCDYFPGFCAKRPGTSASQSYPDFKALSTQQPACSLLEGCLRKGKRYKQSTAHPQDHRLDTLDKVMPHTVKQASTAACNTKENAGGTPFTAHDSTNSRVCLEG